MKTRILAFLGAFLFLTAPVLSAQDYIPTPVKVSQEKVRLNGKVYYSHPVQERQTLFGIAKAYGVTVDDLYEANPGLQETGLRKETTILVPVSQNAVVEKDAPAKSTAYWEHTVKWYESLSDIAAAYGVTQEEIMEANGLTSKKVTKRQVLKIPAKGSVSHSMATGEPVSVYPVPASKAGQEKTEAAAAEPLVLPPEIPILQDPDITDPVVAETGTYKPLEVDPLKVDPAKGIDKTAQTTEESEESPAGGLFDWFTRKGKVDMALLLPFNASGSYSETNMDFYSGVLLALRDLDAEGVKVNLNVYDFQAGIPSASELAENDFVLGPVSTKDLTSVLERAGGRVPVISPLDQRAVSLADTYDGFIQAPSAADNQYEDLALWAAADAGRGDKIILVTEKVSGSTAPAVGVRNALLDAGISFEGVSYTQAEGRSLPSSLTSRLTKGGVNRIIVASEKEAFIGDAVRNLGILRNRGYNIVMYAPSKVRTFDNVDGTSYHQNNLHIASSYFVDYNNPEVRRFVRAYRALYRTEPSQFAFQGYDTAKYFVRLCAKYGKRWTGALDREESSGLHTDFRFRKTAGGSYRNTAVRRIVYNRDYTTELAR